MLHLADGKLVNDLSNDAYAASRQSRCRRPGRRKNTVKLYDVADLAIRNLRESVFRNSLTTIGISVGVASLVAMLSLGIGLQQLASAGCKSPGCLTLL